MVDQIKNYLYKIINQIDHNKHYLKIGYIAGQTMSKIMGVLCGIYIQNTEN